MTKSQLIQAISARMRLSATDAETAVNAVLGEISEALGRGDRVELRGFGSFGTKIRKAREGRNPKTGQAVLVPEKRAVFFKAGKEMKERVDS